MFKACGSTTNCAEKCLILFIIYIGCFYLLFVAVKSDWKYKISISIYVFPNNNSEIAYKSGDKTD